MKHIIILAFPGNDMVLNTNGKWCWKCSGMNDDWFKRFDTKEEADKVAAEYQNSDYLKGYDVKVETLNEPAKRRQPCAE